MAIKQGIWPISCQPKKLKPAALADEALLEDQVMKDISTVGLIPFSIVRVMRAVIVQGAHVSRLFTQNAPLF
mgnify:CR=1 FL=1